jgi:hypothetical protein
MVGIYKITSPTSKVYIGQSINIPQRWKGYNKKKCCEQVRLSNSFKKYGVASHIFEVIEECQVGDLNTRERHWQDFYNVLGKKGLNCRLTGTSEKTGYISNFTRQKITESKINHPLRSKKILQYSLEGILINEFPSISEALRIIGKGDIDSCLQGKQKQAGGYQWVYREDDIKLEIQPYIRASRAKYTTDGARKEAKKLADLKYRLNKKQR